MENVVVMSIGENIASFRNKIVRVVRSVLFIRIVIKYRQFTMAPALYYWRNLLIVDQWRHLDGCVVECGVWRGGVSAGMAEVLGKDREYFLFDSFEGLPPAGKDDGEFAKKWQADTESETYYDNCAAEIDFAERAMKLSGSRKYNLKKGWFEDTLPEFVPPCKIAVLRLDGDWYDSTMVALDNLYKYLAPNALVIIDDYYAWDGCSRAVHDFLSKTKSLTRISKKYNICVLDVR